jgi:hypothetical protein
MNWAETWAARRVVEATKMEVSCILGGGSERWMSVYTMVLISRLLSKAVVVGVDGFGGGEVIEGEINAMAGFLLFFKHWSLVRGCFGVDVDGIFELRVRGMRDVYGALGPMVGQIMQRRNGR